MYISWSSYPLGVSSNMRQRQKNQRLDPRTSAIWLPSAGIKRQTGSLQSVSVLTQEVPARDKSTRTYSTDSMNDLPDSQRQTTFRTFNLRSHTARSHHSASHTVMQVFRSTNNTGLCILLARKKPKCIARQKRLSLTEAT